MVTAMCPADWLLLAQQTPTIDGMYWLLLTSRVLHVFGSIVLVGGLFYLRMVVTPTVVAGAGAPPDAQFGGRRAAWVMWIGISTLFLLASGFFNYIYFNRAYEKLPSGYHILFGVKFLLAMALFFLASILAGRSHAAEKLRQNMRMWLGVCCALGVAIVILAAVMRTYQHTPKAAADERMILAPANPN